MKIYLIRHGQTTGDVEDRYGGAYDDELTDIGQMQAQELAHKLVDTNIQILFCSPLKRAQQTAAILKAELVCKVETIQDLRERNKNGILTGMTKHEAESKYPDLVEQLKDYKNQIRGAESQEAFAQRIKNIFHELIHNSNYETIGIVTHGMPFWVIFADILNDHGITTISDCAYAVLRKDENELSLEEMYGIERS